MYNSMLDTFIAVADCGSFTKAAERLFISPTCDGRCFKSGNYVRDTVV